MKYFAISILCCAAVVGSFSHGDPAAPCELGTGTLLKAQGNVRMIHGKAIFSGGKQVEESKAKGGPPSCELKAIGKKTMTGSTILSVTKVDDGAMDGIYRANGTLYSFSCVKNKGSGPFTEQDFRQAMGGWLTITKLKCMDSDEKNELNSSSKKKAEPASPETLPAEGMPEPKG